MNGHVGGVVRPVTDLAAVGDIGLRNAVQRSRRLQPDIGGEIQGCKGDQLIRLRAGEIQIPSGAALDSLRDGKMAVRL
jgi:hypothetical protein